jgi:hypothetical protein
MKSDTKRDLTVSISFSPQLDDSSEFGELETNADYKFTEKDSPMNLLFCKDGSIRAATVLKLVEKITAEKSYTGMRQGDSTETDT